MARWEPDSRGRLWQAAFDLYGERGFENTTVAEIADRAGLTERTFFRHFADKREVLFAGSEDLEAAMVAAIAAAPESAAPLQVVAAGLRERGWSGVDRPNHQLLELGAAGEEHLALVGEVAEEGALGEPGLAGDLSHGRVLEAAFPI